MRGRPSRPPWLGQLPRPAATLLFVAAIITSWQRAGGAIIEPADTNHTSPSHEGILFSTVFPSPDGLRVVNATKDSILLRWNYTTAAGDLLTGFRIHYFHEPYEDVKTIGTKSTMVSGSSSGGDENSKEKTHFYELSGLGRLRKRFYIISLLNKTSSEPYTVYKIWVNAIVNGEETNASAQLRANTDVDKPSAPILVNVSCHDTGKIYVEWRRPRRVVKKVDVYMLYYKRGPNPTFKSLSVDSTDEEVQSVSVTVEEREMNLCRV